MDELCEPDTTCAERPLSVYVYLYQPVYGQNLHASVLSACCSSGSGSPLGDVTSSPPCDVIAVTSSESRERAMMQGYDHQSLGGGVCSVGVASSSCVDMLLSAPRGASYDFPTTLAPVADGNLMFTGVAADTLVGSPSSLCPTYSGDQVAFLQKANPLASVYITIGLQGHRFFPNFLGTWSRDAFPLISCPHSLSLSCRSLTSLPITSLKIQRLDLREHCTFFDVAIGDNTPD